MLTENKKKVLTDARFDANEDGTQFLNHVFVRLVAKGRTFRNVDFRYTTFQDCYFRYAKFDSCDFTGCHFVGTNFFGATFSGCRFEYATFEKTNVDPAILDTEYPKQENLRMRFARTLRLNFQGIGDAAAVNKAMKMELEATGTHLYKAFASSEDYYRKKYHGILWWKVFYEWVLFRVGDFVWGNGERLERLFRCVVLILGVMTLYDAFTFGDPHISRTYWDAFLRSFDTFMGVPQTTVPYPGPYVAIVTLIRLVAVGFLLSIIIKKFNRR